MQLELDTAAVAVWQRIGGDIQTILRNAAKCDILAYGSTYVIFKSFRTTRELTVLAAKIHSSIVKTYPGNYNDNTGVTVFFALGRKWSVAMYPHFEGPEKDRVILFKVTVKEVE